MSRRPPSTTRTEHTLSLHDALPSYPRSRRPAARAKAARPLGARRAAAQGARRFRRRRFGRKRRPVQSGRFGEALEMDRPRAGRRSEEHTSELQSLMRISYAVFCLKKKNKIKTEQTRNHIYK